MVNQPQLPMQEEQDIRGHQIRGQQNHFDIELADPLTSQVSRTTL
jgi:hypothetical protein